MSGLVQTVLAFIKTHWDENKPILLGLSGGPDSLVLLYLLLECQKKCKFTLGIAHIDHGWRPESEQEATQLENLSKELNIPFFVRKLNPEKLKGNLEASSREERLNFFRELSKKHNYQAVILAHQQDDQKETVLKNILEGANLSSCTGMHKTTQIDGLTIWRPLLDISKKALLQWVEEHHVTPFFDKTNFDEKFLRARMRALIIPELSRMFGKKIHNNLLSIGQEAQELQAFLQNHLDSCLQSIETGTFGSFLDCNQQQNVNTPFEIKYLLRKVAERERCCLPREILTKAAHHLILRSANRKFSVGKHSIFVDRGRFFVTSKVFTALPQEKATLKDSFCFGNWIVSVEDYSVPPEKTSSNWKAIWNGQAEVVLPITRKGYEIGPPKMNTPYPRTSSLSKWWNNHKIPAFLREATPVIWVDDDVVAHEFLTGRQNPPQLQKGERWQKIRIVRKDFPFVNFVENE
ncbi:MAG: tRNA(Ile)-lysidine synthase [Chlamydiae bacterium]|nr:tRNA(Ile)-lysidine synthase [Chlamydiota bacterium]